MPTMPSFNSWAPKPDLAGSYGEGQRIQLARSQAQAQINLDQQRMAMASAQAQQEMQMAQQKLAAESQQAEMELMAKEKYNHMQELRHQQELEMEKAYKTAQMGIAERELKSKESKLKSDIDSASQRLAAQNAYQSLYGKKMLIPGMTPQQAAQESILETGPYYHGGPGSAAVRGNPKQMEFGAASPVAGLPDDYKQIQTGPATRRIIHVPKGMDGTTAATQAPGLPQNYKLFNDKLVKLPDPALAAQKRLDVLQKAQSEDIDGSSADDKAKKGKDLSVVASLALKTYREREAEINRLKLKLEQLESGSKKETGGPAVSTIPTIPSQSITNKFGKYKFTVLNPK